MDSPLYTHIAYTSLMPSGRWSTVFVAAIIRVIDVLKNKNPRVAVTMPLTRRNDDVLYDRFESPRG